MFSLAKYIPDIQVDLVISDLIPPYPPLYPLTLAYRQNFFQWKIAVNNQIEYRGRYARKLYQQLGLL